MAGETAAVGQFADLQERIRRNNQERKDRLSSNISTLGSALGNTMAAMQAKTQRETAIKNHLVNVMGVSEQDAANAIQAGPQAIMEAGKRAAEQMRMRQTQQLLQPASGPSTGQPQATGPMMPRTEYVTAPTPEETARVGGLEMTMPTRRELLQRFLGMKNADLGAFSAALGALPAEPKAMTDEDVANAAESRARAALYTAQAGAAGRPPEWKPTTKAEALELEGAQHPQKPGADVKGYAASKQVPFFEGLTFADVDRIANATAKAGQTPKDVPGYATDLGVAYHQGMTFDDVRNEAARAAAAKKGPRDVTATWDKLKQMRMRMSPGDIFRMDALKAQAGGGLGVSPDAIEKFVKEMETKYPDVVKAGVGLEHAPPVPTDEPVDDTDFRATLDPQSRKEYDGLTDDEKAEYRRLMEGGK